MLQTIATVPFQHMLEFLELIELATRQDAESRLDAYLANCRQNGYEPPVALLDLARDNIQRKYTSLMC